MGLTITLYVFILMIAIVVDWRALVQDASVKVWVLYGGLTGFGITLMIVALVVGHDIDIFAPMEHFVRPISRWMFQIT